MNEAASASIAGLLALLIPLLYLSAATAAAALPGREHGAWRLGTALAVLGGAAALAVAAMTAASGPAALRLGPGLAVGGLGELAFSLRLDGVSAAMLALVGFVGAVITAYSRRYLDGDPGHRRFLGWLMATLAAVSVLVLSGNLLLLALAWVTTSLCLHPLLVFYANRPRAVAAAHRKFLVSRLGDACLLAAVALVGSSLGTFELDEVLQAVGEAPSLGPGLQAAALLFAASAILKCAQLPFHGWLIQVMEAPTPVSALLHAGIVNIGGYLLIRMSPLMVEVPAAQGLLLAAGATTAVLAALVMTRQTSVKVTLAWSTCAQMGFMLAQCGLGAYQLALLHLLAHSLYKAHAFLSAGDEVRRQVPLGLLGATPRPGPVTWALAPLAAAGTLLALALILGIQPESGHLLLAGLLVLAVAPLLARAAVGAVPASTAVGGLTLLAALYLGAHAITGWLVPAAIAQADPGALAVGLVLAAFAAAYALDGVLTLRPRSRLARTLGPHLQAGLYLDELFARAAFRLWPARTPAPHGELPASALNARAFEERP